MLNNNLVLDGTPTDNRAIMTLVIGLRTDKGIVLASDSRTTNTSEGRVYENTSKLFVVGKRVAIGVSGAGSLTQPIIEQVIRSSINESGIVDIGKILCEEAQSIYRCQSALLRKDQSIPAEFVLAAWDTVPNSTEEEPLLYGSAMITGFDMTRYSYSPIVTLGNTAYCEVLLRRIFNPAGSIEEAQLLAVFAILETARVVNNVNDRIQMLVVREREVERISSERIDELKAIAQLANWDCLLP
jgi:20S proteasome alpha/beta subunit